MRQPRDLFAIDTEEISSAGFEVRGEPGSDLLDRAQVGWERFLGTLREASDERWI